VLLQLFTEAAMAEERKEENRGEIKKLVNSLVKSYHDVAGLIRIDGKKHISPSVVTEILGNLQSVIFAGFFGNIRLQNESIEYYVGNLIENLLYNLKKQIGRSLQYSAEIEEDIPGKAERISYEFLSKLPKVRELLATDIDASFDGDPAAFSKDDIILSYPGIYAIMASRLAHELYLLGVPLIPRMMTEHAHSLTGIDIHPGASIGHHFFIDHGTGIVIGETTVIGNYVKIYQGVTLGALSTRGGQSLKNQKRHPTIEDNVTVYSGSSIFGGTTVIGEGAVIGSNAFIIKSVPRNTKVSIRNPELQFMNTQGESVEFSQNEFWDYSI
jgi:serine O-acetyltransferase